MDNKLEIRELSEDEIILLGIGGGKAMNSERFASHKTFEDLERSLDEYQQVFKGDLS